MEWTTEKPTESGCYWIYTQYGKKNFYVMPMEIAVNVDKWGDKYITFDIPATGYECEHLVSPATTTHYMKMVEPLPPITR